MRTDDEYIIHQCLNGDKDAFGLLVDKYNAEVYALVYSKLRNFHDAQDLTQEVFIKAYEKLHTLRQRDRFAGWLHRIASRMCLNWIRDQSIRPERELLDDNYTEMADMHSLESYQTELDFKSVYDMLDSLPEMQCRVLVLSYFDGMKSSEIARFMGVSSDIVRQRLVKARAALKVVNDGQLDSAPSQTTATISNPIISDSILVYVDDSNNSGIENGTILHPFNTIQKGIDSVANGGTVLVMDGYYTGVGNKNLDFNGKNITVKSVNGAEATIIDCENSGRGFYFHTRENSNAKVQGFTIRNGYVPKGAGGGIHCYGATPTIIDNIFENNRSFVHGGGISFGVRNDGDLYHSSPCTTTIAGNIFRGNRAYGGYGGGLCIYGNGLLSIENNLFIGNTTNSDSGGAAFIGCSSAKFVNNRVTQNTTDTRHSAVYIEIYSSSVVLKNNIIWDNNVIHQVYNTIGANLSVSCCDIRGSWSGTNNYTQP